MTVDTLRRPLVLTLSRRFAASPETLFRAWIDPEALKRWSAPTGFTIPSTEGELAVGGSWRATMRAPDGTEHTVVGTYREIVPPSRLVFTHAWLEDGRPGIETLVTVTLEPDGDGTLLTLVQTGFESAASREGHGEGWSQSLDRLGDLIWSGFKA